MPSPPATPLRQVLEWARDGGAGLTGLVACGDFDGCQPKGRRAVERLPGCGTILVAAAGPPHACDAAPVAETAARLAALGHVCRAVYPGDRYPLNFAQLGEMAGLGTVSPVVGKLIHPQYGLWVHVLGAVLVEGRPFGSDWPPAVDPSFQPCLTCSRPCVKACPAGVYDHGRQDMARCAAHRHGGACRDGCDVRRACPVGAEYRPGAAEERRRQTETLALLRRQHGLGKWRFVPRALRG